MAQAASKINECKTCHHLAKDNLQLRHEAENRDMLIQDLKAQLYERKALDQTIQRGVAYSLNIEEQLVLEKASLIAANQRQSIEMKDMGVKIRQLEAENAQLKDDLNVTRQEYEPTAFYSEHPPQLEEEEDDDEDDDDDEDEEEDVGNCHTDRAAGNRREARSQVAEEEAENWELVEVLHVVTNQQDLMTLYDPEMKIVAIKHQARNMYENFFDFGCLKYDDRRIKISQNDTRTLAEVGIPPNATLRLVGGSEGCNLL